MRDSAVVKTRETEGGIVVTSMSLGTVVNPSVTPNAVGVGDYAAVSLVTHGGIHNSSVYITECTGSIRMPAVFDRIDEESEVVPEFNIKSAPGEITVNFVSVASDTECPVKVVYDYGALSTADNIPLMFATRCFPERGVDTAMYLIIKHTDGYVVHSGGATADYG